MFLYKERSLAVRSIRDYFTSDAKEILIDDDAVFNEVKNFVLMISPRHCRIVKRYTADQPIYTKYQLEVTHHLLALVGNVGDQLERVLTSRRSLAGPIQGLEGFG